MFNRTRAFFKRRTEKVADLGKRVVGTEEIKTNWGFIEGLWKALGRKNQKVTREETFSNAYRRLKLTEERLAEVYKGYVFRFYLFYGLMMATVLFMAYSMATGEWFTMVACLGFLAVCGALSFQASFRALQLRMREMAPISVWTSSPSEWFPPFQLPKPGAPTDGSTGRGLVRKGD
jgi:hypothetical protein